MNNWAILGALPATLLGDKEKSWGFANVIDHIQTRLTNGSLLTSTDVKMMLFYFDIFLNLKGNHQDTRFIVSRRLPELGRPGDFSHDQSRLYMEQQDGRRLVNELAAAFKSHEFVTFFDCNDSPVTNVWCCAVVQLDPAAHRGL